MSNHHSSEVELSWRSFHLARAKLQASSKTSALLSGFAMVCMVEVHLEESLPEALVIAFTVCTTLVVAVHLVALLISTCILPHIDAISNSKSISELQHSPHVKMHQFIELAWICSTGIGILLFLAQISVLAWVRFYGLSQNASIVTTVIIVPVLGIFIGFSMYFYRRLVSTKFEQSTKELEELECIVHQLDTRPKTPTNM